MSIKDIALLLYSSFYFLVTILLECIIYEKTKKDDNMNVLFYSLIIIEIIDKYNIKISNIIPCFILWAETIIMILLEAYESAFNILKDNNNERLIHI